MVLVSLKLLLWQKLHCHSHELSVELALSTVHIKCTDTLFPFVFGMSLWWCGGAFFLTVVVAALGLIVCSPQVNKLK